jgi:hypothetical protein
VKKYVIVFAVPILSLAFFVSSASLLTGAARQASGNAAAQAHETSPPTFYKNVLPILQSRCQSCHRSGEAAPMPLVTYQQTRPWAGQIAAAVRMKMMPPWFADPRYGHFSDDPSLTDQQIATIAAWDKAGAPAGDPHDAPPPRGWNEGWNIGQPDVVVKMPKAVQTPARGEVEYMYEIVPTHFSADKWGRGASFEPCPRASRGCLHTAARFPVAATCAGRRAIHRVHAD